MDQLGRERSVMDPHVFVAGRAGAPASPAPPPSYRYTRWGKTRTTFGPLGRITASVALFLPMVFFWETQTFGWPGLVVWGGAILPWGLRDVWQRGRLRQD
jgi:hypothetical protein